MSSENTQNWQHWQRKAGLIIPFVVYTHDEEQNKNQWKQPNDLTIEIQFLAHLDAAHHVEKQRKKRKRQEESVDPVLGCAWVWS